MAKRKKKPKPPTDLMLLTNLLQLRAGIDQHCHGLRAVTKLLESGNTAGAIARLDGAVSSLHALVKEQCAGQTIACPHCGSAQGVEAWALRNECEECGGHLDTMSDDD